jgi:hypothetical protein
MSNHTPREYVFAILAGAVLLATFAGGVNFVVDPYQMNGLFLVDRVNRIKPESESHERLYKAARLAQQAPSVLAMGTSRTEVGIRMNHPSWQGSARQRYNAALGGANIYEISRYFEHAHRIHPLKQVVIGLDFLAFNFYKANGPDFDEQLLFKDDQESVLLTLLEQAKIYLSGDTFSSSMRTLSCNVRACSDPYLASGEENPVRFESGWAQAGGAHNAFVIYARKALTDLNFPPPLRRFSLTGPDGASPIQHLRRILEISYRDGVDLRLFISPAHARQWEALAAAGLWPEFERWKRSLVLVMAEVATAHPTSAPIPLWDFADYSDVSTEAVPAAGGTMEQMTGYWESSHYKTEVGDLVLNRVLAGDQTSRREHPDFGILLDVRMLDAHLAAVRWRAEQYRHGHPAEVAEIAALARETESLRNRVLAPTEN